MWNQVKTVQGVSEKKTVKNFMILYMNIAQGPRQITPKMLMVAKQFYFFNHTILLSAISL